MPVVKKKKGQYHNLLAEARGEILGAVDRVPLVGSVLRHADNMNIYGDGRFVLLSAALVEYVEYLHLPWWKRLAKRISCDV